MTGGVTSDDVTPSATDLLAGVSYSWHVRQLA
jgi:hypothetical protein